MIGIKFFILIDNCVVETKDWIGPQKVAEDFVHTSHISTVFLGIEHLGGIFETMVFGGPIDGFQQRCNTVQESKEIHARVVSALKSTNWLQYYLDGNIESKILNLIDSPGELLND